MIKQPASAGFADFIQPESISERANPSRKRPLRGLFLVLGLALALLLPLTGGNCADLPAPGAPEVGRPGADSGPTKVSIGVWVSDVTQINSVAQTFSASVFLALSWRDPRLAHGTPGIRRYKLADVWHPNWLIANTVGRIAPMFPQIVEVTGDGTVRYRQGLTGTFAQRLNLRAFPFDHARFRLHFVMVGLQPGEIEFVPNETMVAAGIPEGSSIAPALTLQDWRITEHSARVLPYQIAPGAQAAGYAFEFRGERLSQHYVVKVVIPLLLIVIMSWTAFWIDPTLGSSQISVAVTSMLTLIAYRFAVGAEVPKLPYLTHLDTFILVSSILVLLTLIEVIVTSTLAIQERPDLARRVDHYCRAIFPLAYAAVIAATLLN